ELLGNLLDNAMKWAKSAVAVTVAPISGKMTGSGKEGAVNLFEISIEDDGPGIPEDKAREALKRGRRLDETKPGTGLGLAIVADLVNEYGGVLALERSSMGGLKAVVRLRSLH
ncbi:ATP-binding protein, partial [Mesorhizobium sp.]